MRGPAKLTRFDEQPISEVQSSEQVDGESLSTATTLSRWQLLTQRRVEAVEKVPILIVNVNNLCRFMHHLLPQTAEQDAYDFFTSAIDGDVLDHIPLPRRNLNVTIEAREQGVPPAAASAVGEGEPTAVREEERDEADTSALLEQQVNL